jgi:hypothetical protein
MSLKNIGNYYYNPLETFCIPKEKFFNPEYNTDMKHSGNLMEQQILYIILLFHNDTYPKPSGNQMCKCILFIHLK